MLVNINLVEKVFGPNIEAIKSKTTKRAPTPIFSNVIEILKELLFIQEEVVLQIDSLSVNSLKFLTVSCMT